MVFHRRYTATTTTTNNNHMNSNVVIVLVIMIILLGADLFAYLGVEAQLIYLHLNITMH